MLLATSECFYSYKCKIHIKTIYDPRLPKGMKLWQHSLPVWILLFKVIFNMHFWLIKIIAFEIIYFIINQDYAVKWLIEVAISKISTFCTFRIGVPRQWLMTGCKVCRNLQLRKCWVLMEWPNVLLTLLFLLINLYSVTRYFNNFITWFVTKFNITSRLYNLLLFASIISVLC